MADPFWERFCTPLAQRILALIESKAREGSDQAPFILEENIDGVLGDGRYTVGGVALATKGKAKLNVGQRVHVLWRKGKRDLILTHHWKRAQHAGAPLVGGALVEELYLLGTGAERDIWFRNATVAGSLNLRSVLAGEPDGVAWGANENAFLVRCGSTFHTFTFSRPGRGAALTALPAPELLRTEHPWDGTPLLAVLGWTYSDQWVTPSWKQTSERLNEHFAEDFDPSTPTGHFKLDITSALAPTLTRSAGGTYSRSVSLTEAAVTAGHVEVMHAALDADNRLVLSLRVQFGAGLVAGLPVVTVAGVANTDDCTALSQAALGAGDEIVTGALGRRTSGPAAPDFDEHACVLNVTTRTLLWKSWTAAPSFSQLRSAVPGNALGMVAQNHEVETFDWMPSSDTDVTSCAAPSNTAGDAFLTRSTPPPTDPSHTNGGAVDLGTLPSYVNDDLGMVDAAGALAFLSLPTLRSTFVAALVRYANVANIGEWHEESTSYESGPPVSTFAATDRYFQATLGGTNSYRSAMLSLELLVYEPRTRTVVLFAALDLYNSEGDRTGVKRSVWRVNISTGASVALLPWFDAPTFGVFLASGSARVLGVSRSFVLWLRIEQTALSQQTWRVLLTHAVPGADSGGTSTVLEVVQAGFSTPAAITAFIAEHTQPLYPEAMWYPTPPDERVLNAWTGSMPTLVKDASYPPIRQDVPREVTALLEYPTAPTWGNPAALSWHLLENDELLAQYDVE